MTQVPDNLTKTLRRHGCEPNMVIPEAVMRRMAAELRMPISELREAITRKHREPKPAPAKEPASMKTPATKPKLKREQVRDCITASGRAITDTFSKQDKADIAEKLGLTPKAVDSHLDALRCAADVALLKRGSELLDHPAISDDHKDTLVKEMLPLAEYCGKELGRIKSQQERTFTASGPATIMEFGGDICEVVPQVRSVTTMPCEQHPTHTATHCAECVREAEVRTRTETAAQFQPQIGRALRERDAEREYVKYCKSYLEPLFPDTTLALMCETAAYRLQDTDKALLEYAARDAKEPLAQSALRTVGELLGLDASADTPAILEAVRAMPRKLDAALNANGKLQTELDDMREQRDWLIGEIKARLREKRSESRQQFYRIGTPLLVDEVLITEERKAPEFTEPERLLAIGALSGRDCGDNFRLCNMTTRSRILQLAADMAALAAAR